MPQTHQPPGRINITCTIRAATSRLQASVTSQPAVRAAQQDHDLRLPHVSNCPARMRDGSPLATPGRFTFTRRGVSAILARVNHRARGRLESLPKAQASRGGCPLARALAVPHTSLGYGRPPRKYIAAMVPLRVKWMMTTPGR